MLEQEPRGGGEYGKFLETAIRWLLIATALLPVVLFQHSLIFPYTFGKALVFRAIIETVLVLLAVRIGLLAGGAAFFADLKKRLVALVREPFIIALGAFMASFLLSTLTAASPYHAFWGDAERGGGFFVMLHYVAFALLVAALFQKKDWRNFVRISLVVGGIVIFYAWLERFGVSRFPFALPVTPRPGSFLDNPAFLGGYLLFLMALAGVSTRYSEQRSSWRVFSYLVGIAAIPTLFLADVRGAILGFFAGAFFLLLYAAVRNRGTFFKTSPRRIALGTIGLLVLVGIVFGATRQASLWRSIPGVNRIASFTLNDSSLQTRLHALRVGVKAFVDSPKTVLLGWGAENYLVGYNKYFDPGLFLYEDAWFDRAHNIFAEVAITQGVIGLAAYGALFVVLFLLLFRLMRRDDEDRPTLLFLAAGIMAYVVQNLFLFDHPVGLMMFFAFIGFLLSLRLGEREYAPMPAQEFRSAMPIIAGWFAIAGGALLFYLTVVVPFSQSRLFVKTLSDQKLSGQKVLAAAPRFFEPYTYLQPTIRFRFLEILTEANLMREAQFDPLTNVVLEAVEDVVGREPYYDPRNYIKLAEAYNEKGKERPEFFKQAEEYSRKALELTPRRLNIFYALSFALAGQDRFDEAVAVARDAVALNPELGKAHFNLGLQLALAGRKHWIEAEQEFSKALDLQGRSASSLGEQDMSNLITIYKEMLYIHVATRSGERIVAIAEELRRVPGVPLDEVQNFIALAKAKRWADLDKLVGR